MFNPLKAKLDGLRIILATSSEQRHAILRPTGVKFEVVVSDFPENLDRNSFTFSEYVQETALCKVKAVHEKIVRDGKVADIIIGMDTMVCCDGKMYGKPKDKEDAIATIRKLTNSGLPHIVYTGIAIKYKEIYEKFVEVTTVYMNELTEEEILGYVETGESMGKAGAYAIQGIAGSFVKRIDGDVNNVIGLPLCAITSRLKKMLNNS